MHTPTRLPALSQVHNRFLEELRKAEEEVAEKRAKLAALLAQLDEDEKAARETAQRRMEAATELADSQAPLPPSHP